MPVWQSGMAIRCCEALGHIANVCKARLRLADVKRREEVSRDVQNLIADKVKTKMAGALVSK